MILFGWKILDIIYIVQFKVHSFLHVLDQALCCSAVYNYVRKHIPNTKWKHLKGITSTTKKGLNIKSLKSFFISDKNQQRGFNLIKIILLRYFSILLS